MRNDFQPFFLCLKTTLLSKGCWHIWQNQTVKDVEGKVSVSTPIVALPNATGKRALIFVFSVMNFLVRKRILILI
jgi:hypothetical protein